MEAYEKFKSDLALSCERGRISKTIKKRFSRFVGEDGKLVADVCAELNGIFLESPRESSEYREVAELTCDFIMRAVGEGFKRDGATVCAYIKLTQAANSSDSPESEFEKLKKHIEEYNRSLQNIAHSLPIF